MSRLYCSLASGASRRPPLGEVQSHHVMRLALHCHARGAPLHAPTLLVTLCAALSTALSMLRQGMLEGGMASPACPSL